MRRPREATPRHFLMCRPTYFTVEYEINPWMHTAVPTDTARAVAQWEELYDTYVRLGHRIDLIEPVEGLPDMVYAANGGFVLDGTAYGAQFRHPQRTAEADHHRAWYEQHGWRFAAPTLVNEGEGDLAWTGELILAGYGFRTDHAAHREVQEVFGRPVISLELVDSRFYHLDTALTVLAYPGERAGRPAVAYFPEAFSSGSQRVLRQLFPDAVIADEADASAFGLNAVSDGQHVVLNAEATGMADKLTAAGYTPVPVDLSELKKGGGSVKCCVQELRA